MRVLFIHPALQSAEGHYGFISVAEQLGAYQVEADVASAPVWDLVVGTYDLVHVSLSQLEYEPVLLERLRALRAAGVKVVVDIDQPLQRGRLGELRRQVAAAGDLVRVYQHAVEVQALLPAGTRVVTVAEPPLRVNLDAQPTERAGVVFWPAGTENEQMRLIDWAALLAGNPELAGHYRLHLAEWSEAHYQSEVVPHPELLRNLRAGGTAAMRVALQMLARDKRTLQQLLRAIPAGVALPTTPFVVNRAPVDQPLGLATELAVTNGYRTLSADYTELLRRNPRASSAVPQQEPYARLARSRRTQHWNELFATNRLYVLPSGFAGDEAPQQETLSLLALAAGCIPVGGPKHRYVTQLGGGRPGQALYKATKRLLSDPAYFAQELARLRALAAQNDSLLTLVAAYHTLLA